MNLKEFTEKYGNKEVEEAKLKRIASIKDSKAWKPLLDEQYWYNDGFFGGIDQDCWMNVESDRNRYSLGNCYKTKEEAIFAREKQIFMTKLERDFAENSDEIDWKSVQSKYNIYINGEGYIKIEFYRNTPFGVPVTTNKEWLQNYIKENEADIKNTTSGKGNEHEV